MKVRARVLGVALLLSACAGMLGLSAPALAASAASATAATTSPGTFIKGYAAVVGGSQLNLSPVDVAATADGGSIALSQTTALTGQEENWLVKLTAAGVRRWQEQAGCASPATPGAPALGASVQQTADGGYVVGGGTGCGSDGALAEKLTAAGKLAWARVYRVSPDGGNISQLRQTADGGCIAAGSFQDANQNTGAFVLKLDAAGGCHPPGQLPPVGADVMAGAGRLKACTPARCRRMGC